MQIRELIIYGENGKVRKVSFELGKVNIITGKSKTGKSAIGDIIDYCLGGDSCNIADGVVRENSLWYGLLLQFDTERVFVARKNPEIGQQTTNVCYIEIGENINSPNELNFEQNETVSGIETLLSNRIGISENLNIPHETQTRRPLSANIRHALYYCFQNQDEIAAKSFLFHRQSEPFITQSIKDTLPYFMGIVNEKFLILESERSLLKRKVSIEKRKLEELEMLQGGGLQKAITLISEAKAVGLIQDEHKVDYGNFTEIHNLLKSVEDWTPDNIQTIGMDKISYLQTELDKKQQSLFELNEDVQFAKTFNGETSFFSEEVEHQKLRLSSIGLFEKIDFRPNHCPLCSNILNNPLPGIESIRTAITSLDNNIKNVSREKPKIRKYIDNLESTRQKLVEEIQNIKAQIDGIYNQNQDAIALRDLYTRKAKILGRISLWLESVKDRSDLSNIEERIMSLNDQIKKIDKQLDRDTLEERKQYSLSRISTKMTEWATQLDLEHSANPYRLDMNKVTVVVDKPDRVVPLQQLGSGSNWVGVHLIAYFALQSFFIENKRPVPHFLFLDQPSQVYFPSKVQEKDTDWNMVGKIYDFINERVKTLNKNLQIIVVDHANLVENENFESCIIENWHHGEKLIPTDWYK
ncbi:DUF3732 domain-containing protein [Bacillus pumilus]|nr:DUF3732 domain-containing protein [Bacillus pumilus]WOP21378.1 DUF3732 domain-containing protein [Bacillus pumilus]